MSDSASDGSVIPPVLGVDGVDGVDGTNGAEDVDEVEVVEGIVLNVCGPIGIYPVLPTPPPPVVVPPPLVTPPPPEDVEQSVAEGVIVFVTVPAPEYARVRDEPEPEQMLEVTSLVISVES